MDKINQTGCPFFSMVALMLMDPRDTIHLGSSPSLTYWQLKFGSKPPVRTLQ